MVLHWYQCTSVRLGIYFITLQTHSTETPEKDTSVRLPFADLSDLLSGKEKSSTVPTITARNLCTKTT